MTPDFDFWKAMQMVWDIINGNGLVNLFLFPLGLMLGIKILYSIMGELKDIPVIEKSNISQDYQAVDPIEQQRADLLEWKNRADRVRAHEAKQRSHRCAYCGNKFVDNGRGGCKSCGGPRDD